MVKEKVTAIIPTFNEEIHIEDAIRSVSFADEIIVIDSYSTDQTLELVKKHNVKIIQREFDDFSSQKNYATEKAKHNWIYILDADERISEKLKKEIIDALCNTKNLVGFDVYRTFYYYNNKRIKYGGRRRDKVIRLFRKDKCRYNGSLVHEKVSFNGSIGRFKNRIDHYSYKSFEQYNQKLEHYATLKAQSLFAKKRTVNFYHVSLKPPIRFFIEFFIRFGFLDGKAGMVLASHHSNGVRMRYKKLKQLYKKQAIFDEKVMK